MTMNSSISIGFQFLPVIFEVCCEFVDRQYRRDDLAIPSFDDSLTWD